jgi:hypothetical protein
MNGSIALAKGIRDRSYPNACAVGVEFILMWMKKDITLLLLTEKNGEGGRQEI